jgi:hypothetical protein
MNNHEGIACIGLALMFLYAVLASTSPTFYFWVRRNLWKNVAFVCFLSIVIITAAFKID